ncbi:MAG: hypothetical protein ACP5E4_02175 [Candidatus Aenigmatarchaeota archaeon]
MALNKRITFGILFVALVIFGAVYLSPDDDNFARNETVQPSESYNSSLVSGQSGGETPVPPPIEEPKAREYFPEESPEGWDGLIPELNPESCEGKNRVGFALGYCNISEIVAAYSKRWVEQSGQNGAPIRVISGNVFVFAPGTQEKLGKVMAAIKSSPSYLMEYPVYEANVKRYESILYLPKIPGTPFPSSPDDASLEEDFEKLIYYLDVFEKGEMVYALYYEATAKDAAEEIEGYIMQME